MRTERSVESVWTSVVDPSTWLAMPGAEVTYRVLQSEPPTLLRYVISGGLPVCEHAGSVVLEPTSSDGTEIVLHEAFRGRIWGTTGYLRGRRERALVDIARSWASPSSTLGGQ